MTERRVSVSVGLEAAGMRLDLWLAERFTYHSRSRWQRLIREGAIVVDGEPAKSAAILREGSRIAYGPTDDEPPVDLWYEVVHDDACLLAVNKSGDLPCHPGARYFRHTLWHLLRDRLDEPRLVNRLDRETSGLVLVARDATTARLLGAQFAAHTAVKEYLVLVEGDTPAEFEAVGRLEKDPGSRVAKKLRFVPDETAASPAITAFRRLHAASGLTLLHATPRTGRLHQIRATLCSLGWPIVGDKLYGYDDACFLAFIEDRLSQAQRDRLRLPRQALHAARLSVDHPAGGRLHLTAPLPPDFAGCLLQHGFPETYSYGLPPGHSLPDSRTEQP